MTNQSKSIEEAVSTLKPPVLFVSSAVGLGNYSVGEALRQRCFNTPCYHMVVEDLLPQNAVNEDLNRYKWISSHLRPLLYIIYSLPLFYFLKYARERWGRKTDLSKLDKKIKSLGIQTVVSISHRPSFWLSLLKNRTRSDYKLIGVLSEFGTSLGWKYIFWESMDSFLSVMPQNQLRLPFPLGLSFENLQLPCRQEFSKIFSLGEKNSVLLVAGHWGEIKSHSAISLLMNLLKELPDLTVHVVCGTNRRLKEDLEKTLCPNSQIKVYGALPSLVETMSLCSSVITKPGFSTLIEAYCASRKIFLLKGMPVAEDHNASYAINNFAAEWYSIDSFKKWFLNPN